MGKLIDLAKSIAGEKGLHGRVGRWILAVSSALDGDAAAYVMAARYPTVQAVANLAAATTVVFNSLVSSLGDAISFNPATGEFTLQPGVYELDARLNWEGFDTVATDVASFVWRDSADNDLATGAFGIAVPGTSGLNVAPQSTTKALVRVTAVTVVRVVSVGGSGGADVGAGSFATVRKIG